MVATISADIVRSTSLRTEEYLLLREKLTELLENLEKDYPGFWARIVRGDGIECYVPEYRYVLRLALLLKLYVKLQVNPFECSDLLKKHGIRFSIGMAQDDYSSREDDLLYGPAINMSGRNLDGISRRDVTFSAIQIDPAPETANYFVSSYVALVCGLADTYSFKQAEVVYYKLRGMKEVQIAERLGIRQSSVNIRSSSASWNLLDKALADFENFNFMSICG